MGHFEDQNSLIILILSLPQVNEVNNRNREKTG